MSEQLNQFCNKVTWISLQLLSIWLRWEGSQFHEKITNSWEGSQIHEKDHNFMHNTLQLLLFLLDFVCKL